MPTWTAFAISIHALREEGDHFRGRLVILNAKISIHALREEGDQIPIIGEGLNEISIHALREEGDGSGFHHCKRRTISIHALREEGDSKNRDKISIFKQIIQHSARI